MSDEAFPPRNPAINIEEGDVFAPAFDETGLLPAIVSDARTAGVLMLAWMNAEALELTLSTGVVHFWSRSRKRIWKKGEQSGNTLRVVEIRTDCDQDVIWVRAEVEGDGRACHTGRRSCFYRRLDKDPAGAGVKLTPIESF